MPKHQKGCAEAFGSFDYNHFWWNLTIWCHWVGSWKSLDLICTLGLMPAKVRTQTQPMRSLWKKGICWSSLMRGQCFIYLRSLVYKISYVYVLQQYNLSENFMHLLYLDCRIFCILNYYCHVCPFFYTVWIWVSRCLLPCKTGSLILNYYSSNFVLGWWCRYQDLSIQTQLILSSH